MSLSKKQYRDLLSEQERLNSIINPNWKNDRLFDDFVVAMLVESAELIEHLGYKWWKHQEPNLKQAQMECVDIWFFYFSALLLIEKDIETDIIHLSDYEVEEFSKNKTIYFTKSFMNTISSYDSINKEPLSLNLLFCVTQWLGMSTEDLYDMYMGKLVLNIFRQTHGYADGSYKKIWNGLEDNEVLHKIMEDTKDPHQLEKMLEIHYADVK